jgi:L-rhamnose mutarotase
MRLKIGSRKEEIRVIRKAFVMTVYPDQHEEYEKRHNEIWPEMIKELHEHGARNYSIFLDKETNKLFGYLEIEDEEKWSKMASTAINQKWWKFMEPVMETNPDNSPVVKDLKEVFHMD